MYVLVKHGVKIHPHPLSLCLFSSISSLSLHIFHMLISSIQVPVYRLFLFLHPSLSSLFSRVLSRPFTVAPSFSGPLLVLHSPLITFFPPSSSSQFPPPYSPSTHSPSISSSPPPVFSPLLCLNHPPECRDDLTQG